MYKQYNSEHVSRVDVCIQNKKGRLFLKLYIIHSKQINNKMLNMFRGVDMSRYNNQTSTNTVWTKISEKTAQTIFLKHLKCNNKFQY